MYIINIVKTGDVEIKVDSQFNNMQAENVTVKEMVTARIYGVIKENLVVEKKAIVYMHGEVLGKIINEGGTVYVFGSSGDIKTF